MRTKEAEEREVQERTWIYLLHDQAPPTTARHVTPAVLAARSAGVMGDGAHLPLLPPMSATASSRSSTGGSAAGPYLYQRPNALQQQHASPYAAPYHGGYDAYGRPLHAATNNNNSSSSAGYAYNYAASGAEFMAKNPPAARPSSSVVTASEKWHVPVPTAYDEHLHQQQNRGFPPLRAMLSKSDKLPFQIQTPGRTTGPVVMKQQLVETPSAAVAKSKSKKKSADAVGVLPKKRRHDEIDEEYVAPPASSGGLDDLDDDEAKAAKRNCFPKKCDFPMCKNSSRSRGFCYSHGGGRRCRMDGCNNGAVSRDLCKRHGGGRRCRISGCKSSSESGGLCYSHGGGRRCSLSWCSARAKKGGFCAVHIGNENAEPPTEETEAATDAGASTPADAAAAATATTAAADPAEETKAAAVVPPTVAETLLSLAHVASSPTGEASPTSPSLPELSTPRYSSIASILN